MASFFKKWPRFNLVMATALCAVIICLAANPKVEITLKSTRNIYRMVRTTISSPNLPSLWTLHKKSSQPISRKSGINLFHERLDCWINTIPLYLLRYLCKVVYSNTLQMICNGSNLAVSIRWRIKCCVKNIFHHLLFIW